jgi:hypothetical protein
LLHNILTIQISLVQYLFGIDSVLKLLNQFCRTFRWTAWGCFTGGYVKFIEVHNILLVEDMWAGVGSM